MRQARAEGRPHDEVAMRLIDVLHQLQRMEQETEMGPTQWPPPDLEPPEPQSAQERLRATIQEVREAAHMVRLQHTGQIPSALANIGTTKDPPPPEMPPSAYAPELVRARWHRAEALERGRAQRQGQTVLGDPRHDWASAVDRERRAMDRLAEAHRRWEDDLPYDQLVQRYVMEAETLRHHAANERRLGMRPTLADALDHQADLVDRHLEQRIDEAEGLPDEQGPVIVILRRLRREYEQEVGLGQASEWGRLAGRGEYDRELEGWRDKDGHTPEPTPSPQGRGKELESDREPSPIELAELKSREELDKEWEEGWEARYRQRVKHAMEKTIRKTKAKGEALRRKHHRIPETKLDFWDEPGSVPVARFRIMEVTNRHRKQLFMSRSGWQFWNELDEVFSRDDVQDNLEIAVDGLLEIHRRWERWPIPDQVEQLIAEAESLRNHAHNWRGLHDDPLTASRLDDWADYSERRAWRLIERAMRESEQAEASGAGGPTRIQRTPDPDTLAERDRELREAEEQYNWEYWKRHREQQ